MSKTYIEKLKDPRWQKKRLKILERDEWRCQHCGNEKETLAVHHPVYINGLEPWEYKDKDLQTLCDKCHKLDREWRTRFEKLLLYSLRLRDYKSINALTCLIFCPEKYGFEEDMLFGILDTIVQNKKLEKEANKCTEDL